MVYKDSYQVLAIYHGLVWSFAIPKTRKACDYGTEWDITGVKGSPMAIFESVGYCGYKGAILYKIPNAHSFLCFLI